MGYIFLNGTIQWVIAGLNGIQIIIKLFILAYKSEMRINIIAYILILFCVESVAQTSITFNIGKGRSKRNVNFKKLNETDKQIILKNELPYKSTNVELAIEQKIAKRVWAYSGLSYFSCGFETKEVPFTPYWAPNGIPGKEGYRVRVIDKYLVLPIYIGYEIFAKKKHNLVLSSGLGIIYKAKQINKFAFRYTGEPLGWGVSNYYPREFKFSVQLPVKLMYSYNVYRRWGTCIHVQYNYVLGKTYTQITDTGYGYIGIKPETEGRMSYWNISAGVTYQLKK